MRKHPINDESLIIPYDILTLDVLQGLIEEFVTLDRTDTGYEKKSIENDVAMVKKAPGALAIKLVRSLYFSPGPNARIVKDENLPY